MDLQALADFVLVASSGGFAAAGRKTGRPKATLSRHVIELEESLGVRLFERGGRALRLTDEGLALFTRTENLLSDIREAGEAISAGGDQPRGRLRVSAPVLLSQLGAIAADFSRRYPEVELEITAEDRHVDLVEEGYDAVIRANPRPESGLVGRRILRDPQIAVAAPSHPRPAPPYVGFPAVAPSRAPSEPAWEIEGFASPLRPRPVLRLSSLAMVLDAVRAGAGAAILPESLVAPDLASGALVSWGVRRGSPAEIWVLHPSKRLMSAKVRVFVDHLASAFRDGVFGGPPDRDD